MVFLISGCVKDQIKPDIEIARPEPIITIPQPPPPLKSQSSTAPQFKEKAADVKTLHLPEEVVEIAVTESAKHEMEYTSSMAPIYSKEQAKNSTKPGTKPTGRTQPTESPTSHGFRKGQAAYHVPLTMVENKTSNVDLWIDASVSSEELRIRLYEFLEDNAKRANKRIRKNDVKSNASVKDEIVGREVLIGKKMYAELIGTISDFEISPSGKVEATYKEGIPLRWSWLVKPKRDGEEGLPLEIKVTADPGDGQTPIETIREKVIVHAREKTWKEKFEELDWWIKLLTGGGISSIVIWLYKKFRGRQR